ncbi:unnamed protein product [Phaedon cochleariae]|uniref:PHD finger protein 20 n=1 Tax=Phaedon cochleariae TaxID=80249 RepID=A0A9P0DXI3_PHACE|nr:unnamed protein product [Phaedon cochleariae]
MGRKCSVEGCLSDSGRQEDIGVTFHKVPPHSDVRPKWMSLCRIPDDKKLTKVIYICSRHFLRADFCNFKGKKYMLRQGVLPSVFPWDKSKLEAIKAEAKKEKHSDVKDEVDTSFIKNENAESSMEFKEEPLDNIDIESQIPHCEIKVESKEKLDGLEKNKLGGKSSTPINFVINTRIEALDFNNDWFPAKIVEVDYEENEVLIHFEKFSSKYDEWISMNSSRLRPIQASSRKMGPTEKYLVGERCLAAWSDSRKFPATITKVMENDIYEVLFDDGFVKTLKAHRISKSQGKVLQSSPLFDPVKGSKQDRREKKRKINVSALFRKRVKLDHSGEKPKRAQEPPIDRELKPQDVQEQQDIADATLSAESIRDWKPSWLNGKPVGIPSSLITIDGPKSSVIVPDPRLPEGWDKHLLRRTKGTDAARKWDTVITSPDSKKFRSKTDVVKYLAIHPDAGVTEDMFDFSLVSKRKKKNNNNATPAKPPEPVVQPELPVPEEPPQVEEEIVKEENPNALKILFEDDAYKCPIEGCGKTFRRENLAQMHVKHYHPEYTKFLDSTPNVADLAYARTVGENLDKSPGPTKPPPLKPVARGTPKTSKQPSSPVSEIQELKPVGKPKTPAPLPKNKDSEIIKLLNSKPFEEENPEPIQPLPSGLPVDMYPDIKLKDLLTKAEGVPNKEDVNMKSLCATRPASGIKTLLPVHRHPNVENSPVNTAPMEDIPKHAGRRKRGYTENVEIVKVNPAPMEDTPKHPGRRKRGYTENVEIVKGKDPHHVQPHPSSPSPLPQTTPTPTQDTPLPASDPVPPPNDVIIEGGEVIKIVRMKQEEIINCTCGFTEEDGLMIQCELCQCWQHAYCNNIERESQVPDKYVCYICQNPLRERLSRKFYHDQDWMKQGVLPVGSYHIRDNEALQKRFEKLKKCHDMSGGLQELREYLHNLSVKMKIAEAKNHPKLYLWSKPWAKKSLPEKAKPEDHEPAPKLESDGDYLKSELNKEDSSNENSMLMMILKAGKEVMPKIDLNSLMDTNGPMIPQPEAAIDSTDCRLNLLEHIIHQESLVEERLDDYEKQIEALEEGMNMEVDEDYPRTRQTLQMLMRDLDTLKEFSHCTSI